MECAYYPASLNGIVVHRVAKANLPNGNLAQNNHSNRQICGGPRLGVSGDEKSHPLTMAQIRMDDTRRHRRNLA
jgi:hypothetical protein